MKKGLPGNKIQINGIIGKIKNILTPRKPVKVFIAVISILILITAFPGFSKIMANISMFSNLKQNQSEIVQPVKYASLSDITPFKNGGPDFIHPTEIIFKNLEMGKYSSYKSGKRIYVRDIKQVKKLRAYPLISGVDTKDPLFYPTDSHLNKIEKSMNNIYGAIKEEGALKVYYHSLKADDFFVTPKFQKENNSEIYRAYVSEIMETGLLPWASNTGVYSQFLYVDKIAKNIDKEKTKIAMILGADNSRYLPMMLSSFDGVIMVDDNSQYIKWINFLKNFLGSVYQKMHYDARTIAVCCKSSEVCIPPVVDFCLIHFDPDGITNWPRDIENEDEYFKWFDSYTTSIANALTKGQETKNGGYLLIIFNNGNDCQYGIQDVIRNFDRRYPQLVLSNKSCYSKSKDSFHLLFTRPSTKEIKHLETQKGREEYMNMVKKILTQDK